MEARSTRKTRWYRAKSWLKRASTLRKDDDLSARFIFSWIALSALYGQAGPGRKDRQDLQNFLQSVLRVDVAITRMRAAVRELRREAESILGSELLVEGYWKVGLSVEIQRGLRSSLRKVEREWTGGTPERWLTDLFGRLHFLRNQLMHGFATDGAKANRTSLAAAVPILRKLLPIFLWAANRHPDLVVSEAPPYPPKGWQGHPQHKPPAFNTPILAPTRTGDRHGGRRDELEAQPRRLTVSLSGRS